MSGTTVEDKFKAQCEAINAELPELRAVVDQVYAEAGSRMITITYDHADPGARARAAGKKLAELLDADRRTYSQLKLVAEAAGVELHELLAWVREARLIRVAVREGKR